MSQQFWNGFVLVGPHPNAPPSEGWPEYLRKKKKQEAHNRKMSIAGKKRWAAKKQWVATVRYILTEARRREAARSGSDIRLWDNS